jgi:hypothetical protein
VAVKGDEILRLKKLLDEAKKKKEDHKNKFPSINWAINCVNVSPIYGHYEGSSSSHQRLQEQFNYS